MNGVEEILQKHNLKSTKLRKAVLSLLMKSDIGLSHQDISKTIDVEFDRVTLFRTLHSFEETGILHKIIDPNGTAKYAYTQTAEADHAEAHAHFVCTECEEVFCLKDVFDLGSIKVPKGFSKQAIDVQIKGHCKKCA